MVQSPFWVWEVLVLYICPHFEEVSNICDRAAMLTNGRIWKIISRDMLRVEVREVYSYTEEYDRMVRSHLQKREQNGKKTEEILKWKSYSESAGKEISFPIYKGEYLAVQIHENRILQEMTEILKEGRAENLESALQVLKLDLKALNSNVVVEQEEYDEVVAIKSMFLVMDYK